MINDYEIRGDVTAIIINSPKYGRKEALISTSMLARVKEFSGRWSVAFRKRVNTFYVQGCTPRVDGKQKNVVIHRWITYAPKGMVVDHKNHDGLCNTDENLRVCTNAENQQNRDGAMKNSKSGIRGVFWNKQNKKWEAQMRLQGKKIHLGLFADITVAERAVKEARAEYMPFSKEATKNELGHIHTKVRIHL